MHLVVFAVFLGVSTCVSSLILTIEPKHTHIRPGQNATVMCLADAPLTECQFKWKNQWSEGPLIDLSLGPNSLPPSKLSPDVVGYWYNGNGLDKGECGLIMNIGRWGSRIIGCRVRSQSGGWLYADAGVQVDGQKPFSLIPTPRVAVVKLGENVDLLCQAEEPLSDCTFSIPGNNLVRFNKGQQSDQLEKIKYFGTGLENGQCGVTLQQVDEEFNNRIICAGKTNTRRQYEVAWTSVIVAKKPSSVELVLDKNPIPSGENITASCTVKDSRPVANVTWYLGDDIIRQDGVNESPLESLWAWNNLTRTLTQKISRRVTRVDNGKTLTCIAEHLALPKPIEQSKLIIVESPPLCPPLTSSTLDIFCYHKEDYLNCSDHMPPGTQAALGCKTGFITHSNDTQEPFTCLDEGIWNREIFSCYLECGKRNTNAGQVLISNGQKSKVAEFPWHVAIYQTDNNGSYDHICGGTLISPTLVVSAAHCFWNNVNNEKRNETLYKVAAGKHRREWNAEEKIPFQERDINDIIVQERYQGRETSFALDIAILRLSSAVEISATVRIICIDWKSLQNRNDLSAGRNGTVPGWGFTEEGVQPDELKVVDLPYIEYRVCFDALPKETRPVFTTDKFCAGYVNKSISVCAGDSGGGLVFYNREKDRYFLRGIVSIAFRPASNNDKCFSQLYTAFTRLSDFLPWVNRYYF